MLGDGGLIKMACILSWDREHSLNIRLHYVR